MVAVRTFAWSVALVASMMTVKSFAQEVGASSEQPPDSVPYKMELPPDVRAWYRNPDGSCVQCSIGMNGIHMNCPQAYTLLWDTDYGDRVRGGSYPSRVEAYAKKRNIPIYNVTGSNTWEWMQWACKTGRFAAIGAGGAHFQTLYGWNPATNKWYVCNNNSPKVVDEYTDEQFRRLHLASGQWIVVIDKPPPPMTARYAQWWK